MWVVETLVYRKRGTFDVAESNAADDSEVFARLFTMDESSRSRFLFPKSLIRLYHVAFTSDA